MSDIDEALEALDVLHYARGDKFRKNVDKIRQTLEELRLYRQAYGHPELCGLERQRAPDRPVIAEIEAERNRQIEKEGWSEAHDDEHDLGELSMAAAAYAGVASAQARGASAEEFPADMMMMEGDWPWDASWWKPKDQRRNLIRAAALIIAEIERHDRAAPEADDD